MRIYEGLEEFKKVKYPVVSSGTFDGVHIGHQKIINQLNEIALNNKGETVLITFWPHPREVLYPDEHTLKLLTTFEEKAEILAQKGIDHLIKIKFTKAFSELSSEEFIQDILIDKIGTKILVIGYDHRFGKNREGSFDHLKSNGHRYGFKVEEIPRQDIDHVGISSTKIRKALTNGNVITANKYLGRLYHLKGTVVNGNKLGRKLGYPTANINIDNDKKLIPADGVYAVKVRYSTKLFDGMMSIGVRPTVGGTQRTIEVNIFDFDKTIYNENLSIFFVEKFREEMKFDNLDELKKQLDRDWKTARDILSQHNSI